MEQILDFLFLYVIVVFYVLFKGILSYMSQFLQLTRIHSFKLWRKNVLLRISNSLQFQENTQVFGIWIMVERGAGVDCVG